MSPETYVAAFNDTAKTFHDFAAMIIEWVERRREHKEESRDARWDGLLETTDKTRELVTHHRDMIKKAADPILKSGDLSCFVQLAGDVINDDSLPDSYSYLKGAIRQYSTMEVFSKESRDLMENLLGRVRAFQLAAFLIPPEYDISMRDEATDAFGKGNLPSGQKLAVILTAAELVEMLKKPENERKAGHIWGLSGYVLRELAGIKESSFNPTPNLGFETPEEVVALVKLFAENWLHCVRLQIDLGRGVQHWVAALEAQRHNRRTDP